MDIPSSAAFLVRFPREVRGIVDGVDTGCRYAEIFQYGVKKKGRMDVLERTILRMREVEKAEGRLMS